MSYQLYDASGFVADFATAGGLWGLVKYLRQQDDSDMHILAENMALDLTEEIRAKIKNLPLPRDMSTLSLVTSLQKVIDDLDEVLIIGDGLENDDNGKSTRHVELNRRVFSEEEKQARWEIYKAKSERDETAFRRVFGKLWTEQADQVTTAYQDLQDLAAALREEAAVEAWQKSFQPLIQRVFEDALELSATGGQVKPAHRSKQGGVLNPRALEWIFNRSLALARMVNGTTLMELQAELGTAFEAGESVPQIVSRIRDYYRNGYERRATLVARTEVIAASNEGALEGYQAEGVQKAEFYVAQDERTCDECLPLNGRVYPIDEGHGMIPVHPQCLLPENEVVPFGLITATRARYNGQAIEFMTSKGHRLTVTPNHMILTPRGFVKAQSLREGDDVIDCRDSKWIAAVVDPDHDYSPARIEEIWDSLLVRPEMLAMSMPTSAIDFHGDAAGFDGNIDIIFPDRMLRHYVKSFSRNNLNEFPLRRALSTDTVLPELRPGFESGGRYLLASDGSMAGCGQDHTFIASHTGKTQSIRLAAISRSNASINQSLPNNHALNAKRFRECKFRFPSQIVGNEVGGGGNNMLGGRNTVALQESVESCLAYTKLAAQFLGRFSGLISTQQVRQIRNFKFSGHVYDLQTQEELYSVNSLIVKNCRCVWLPVTD